MPIFHNDFKEADYSKYNFQADKWKLRLQCDVQQLENRALLQLIRDFEKMESNLTAKSVNPQKLTPLQSEGAKRIL